MSRAILLAALLVLAAPTGAAVAAGMTEADLLGKDPGNQAAYSCFSRHYDAAHLQSHPKQNVTDMRVFVESTYNAESDSHRDDYLTIGMNFRTLKTEFRVDGGCPMQDGKLTCGGDCGGGGTFAVESADKGSIMVAIPDGAPVYDPASNDEPPDGAAFGSDDKLFKLDRVDLKQCDPLMSDDDRTAIYGKTETAK